VTRAPIVILGGGIAGSAAAIAARQAGAPVTLVEKSTFPRHKVCGEFLSPEVEPILDSLGLDAAFHALQPAAIRRVTLNFFGEDKNFPLPQPAFGLSRFQLDRLLFQRAVEAGAEPCKSTTRAPTILATGRAALAPSGGPKGQRLFGFKAHFAGPVNDAVELYFFEGGYVGVNAVENCTTNVCGLCTEATLRPLNFDIDRLIQQIPALRQRLIPLVRQMDWLHVGPLVFRQAFADAGAAGGPLRAGDSLSFVDPFTGSGMLAALTAGRMAGEMAAAGATAEDYRRASKRALRRPFLMSSVYRWAIWRSSVLRLARWVPGEWLFRWTRPGH